MTQYKALALAPEASDLRRIKRLTKKLLAEYLPTLRLKDPQGVQRKAAMKFKAALRKELRDTITLQDNRTLKVNLFYTDHAHPGSVGAGKKNYWLVDVTYDTKTVIPREVRMLFPVELA